MASLPKNVYIDKLDDTVNKYSNKYHRTIKMRPVDVKSSTYIDFNKENNKEGPKCKVGNHTRISKYKNIFAKSYVSNWSEEIFVIKKVKDTVPLTYVLSDLKDKVIVEKNCKKINQKEHRVGKIIKRKSNKLYVK